MLARLLTPADYGIVAIATIILGSIEIFAQVGLYNAVIRHPNPTREHYDSVWTLTLLLGLFLAVVVVAATPLTVLYFHEPRATPVLMVLALRTALAGFQNPAVLDFQRNVQFHKQFRWNLCSTLTQFFATIGSAILLRNYWALVIGILAKQIALLLFSFILVPYRPRPCLSKASELFSFSLWTLLRNIGNYAFDQIDKIAIGGFAGAAAMGRYDVGRDVASVPVAESIYPMNTVLYPVMASLQHDPGRRREMLLDAIRWSAVICIPAGIGVALVAGDMTDLLLGRQWDSVKPIIPWFALAVGITGLTSSVYATLESLGFAFRSARLQWGQVGGLALLLIPTGYLTRDILWVAIARFAFAAAVSPLLILEIGRALGIRVREFGAVLWRPFLAGAAMAALVVTANLLLRFSAPARLGLDVMLGAGAFAGAMLALWYASGCPNGPEDVVWRQFHRMYAVMAAMLDPRVWQRS